MLYSYRAVDKSGKSVTGERESGSERELADALRRSDLLLLEAQSRETREHQRRFRLAIPNPFGRVTLVERMVFARNLAVMIGAGLALTRALEALEQQTQNPRFRDILISIRQAVTAGKSFADGLRAHEGVFGVLFVNMVESGEISGNLERVLKILARQMQRDHELRAKVRGALIYPAIIVFTLVAIGVLMMIYVVPTLTQTFAELEVELPITTKIIISGSNILLGYYGYFLALAFVIAVAAVRLYRTAAGKRALDTVVLLTPVFGPLIQKLNAARFARTLSSLISSGIQITRALEVTAAVLSNAHFRATLQSAALGIQRGTPLHELLASRPDLFPPLVTQMVEVGEETGTISRMLLRLALFYEEEVATVTKNLSSIIEPVLMIMIGAVVGFFAVSMIQPIYSGLGNL